MQGCGTYQSIKLQARKTINSLFNLKAFKLLARYAILNNTDHHDDQ